MSQPIQIKSKLAGTPQHDPQFKVSLRTHSGQDIIAADPQATRAMIALMDMGAVLGGAASHYGGPAALADLMSALHAFVFTESHSKNKAWNELYNIVNDAGHCENGLYALKANYQMAGLNLNSLKKFRSIESPLTGHGEVHCFPEGVQLSNGPLGSAFPQTQGLAMGDCLAGRERVTVAVVSDGASMEGEAKESFAAIPGLANAGKLAPYVMIISDNNTKLSGRIDAESFSMQPTFAALKTLGWNVIHLENGHDLQKCYDAISLAIETARKNPRVPVAIHAKTIKGIGTKKTADSASGGHGFPLKSPTELPAFIAEIYDGNAYPAIFNEWIEELVVWENKIKASAVKDTGEKIQVGVSSALVRARKEGLPVVSITSDLPGSTGVAGFRKEFPAASFDVGVAESNMISSAIGMSKAGFIPVVDTFAQFGVTKGALPFIMSSLSEAPLIAIFSHTGFQDAADGASHQALSYIAMLSSIPSVRLVNLSCSDEADQLVYKAVKDFASDLEAGRTPPSTVFFLGRENFPKNFGATQFEFGKAQILLDTTAQFADAVTIVTQGSLVTQALAAAEQLQKKSKGCVVINLADLYEIDVNTLISALCKTDQRLLTVEDHQISGGMGQLVAHSLLQNGVSLKLKSLGVKKSFGQSAYTALELYKKHGLDADSIAHQALNLF